MTEPVANQQRGDEGAILEFADNDPPWDCLFTSSFNQRPTNRASSSAFAISAAARFASEIGGPRVIHGNEVLDVWSSQITNLTLATLAPGPIPCLL
jgi:hypothetical protein